METTDATETLVLAYGAFGAVAEAVTEESAWLPTGCTGWAIRDLIFHCLSDAQRGLVALHTPADRPPDRDAVTYWRDWQPGGDSAVDLRLTRIAASVYPRAARLAEIYRETAAAVVHAAAATDPALPVATQGHVLTTGDLLRTLAVEATVHHLDLVVSLPAAPAPTAQALHEVRRTLDGLLGHQAPVDWDDTYYARAGTGRIPLTDADRARLGPDADRFPLFG
jgi:hypothetical protein